MITLDERLKKYIFLDLNHFLYNTKSLIVSRERQILPFLKLLKAQAKQGGELQRIGSHVSFLQHSSTIVALGQTRERERERARFTRKCFEQIQIR